MKLLPTICVVLLLAACKNKTKLALAETMLLADTLFLPKDNLAFYFPAMSFAGPAPSDSFVQNWYASALYNFKEPVLSQTFIGHDTYRFLWLRSFHRPVVLSLHRTQDLVWLNTKMLDQQPDFYDDRVRGLPKDYQQEYLQEGYVVDKQDPDLLIKLADRKANIIYNKTMIVSDKEWNEFEQLLQAAKFWDLPKDIDDGSTDGAEWVIEGHFKNKYHVVSYHSPYDNEYEKAGLFLIKLSGLKEEVY